MDYTTPTRAEIQVRAHRQRAGLTLRQLSEAMEVGFSTITQWEHTGTQPSARVLPRMAEVFGTTVDGLYREPRP
jgi:transcriptional regulator with XRE-family HTH domain